jgi:5'-nucleotidase
MPSAVCPCHAPRTPGYDSDQDTAAQVPGLDVIVGGHSHTFLYTPTSAGPLVATGPGIDASTCLQRKACDKPLGPYPTWSRRTAANGNHSVPIVQAYYSSKYLGLIKVDLGRRRLVPGVLPLLLGGDNSSNPVAQDGELLGILQRYRAPVDELRTKKAGVWFCVCMCVLWWCGSVEMTRVSW